jgi:acetylornithine deacetylase/succinyl-diaminopimelate desuccinylase-like protein
VIDWVALGDETVEVLRRYLMVDTTNPPGNEVRGTQFLAEILAAAGISSEVVESAPGRANIMARVGGGGVLPAINVTAGVRAYTEMLLAIAGA